MALTLTELQAITDYYVDSTDNDIYFKSKGSKKHKFKSIGGLNTVSESYQFEITGMSVIRCSEKPVLRYFQDA
jgi:hypothetical protein